MEEVRVKKPEINYRPKLIVEPHNSTAIAEKLQTIINGWTFPLDPDVPLLKEYPFLEQFVFLVKLASASHHFDDFCIVLRQLVAEIAVQSDRTRGIAQVLDMEEELQNFQGGGYSEEDVFLMLKHYEIKFVEDVQHPKLLPLVNFCCLDIGVEVKPSTFLQAGNGLYALRNFRKDEVICSYGGSLSDRNENDYINGLTEGELNDRSAYALEINEPTSLFHRWVVDSKRFFKLFQPGRWANGVPWNDPPAFPVYSSQTGEVIVNPRSSNAVYLVQNDRYRPIFPEYVLKATSFIPAGSEIIVNYGRIYGWNNIYYGFEKQTEHPPVDEINNIQDGVTYNGYGLFAERNFAKDSIVAYYSTIIKEGNSSKLVMNREMYEELVVNGDFKSKKKFIDEDSGVEMSGKFFYYYPNNPEDYRITDKGRYIKIARDAKDANVDKRVDERNRICVVYALRDIRKGEKLLYLSTLKEKRRKGPDELYDDKSDDKILPGNPLLMDKGVKNLSSFNVF